MNQMNTPEVTLAKVHEFMKTNDDDNAIVIINDFILNSKKKYWTQNHEQLISLLIELGVKKLKSKLLKDGLNYYRNISQNTNIESLGSLLTKTKDLVEDKFLKAQKSYQEIKIDIKDLDSEDSPEIFSMYTFDDEDTITNEKEDLINSQKFIWETYKILLDLTKTNSKLLSLYAQILKSAFTFCKENKRKIEFKRLCDSVRGYLQTLIKTEKKQFFQNKVQISRPEVLKILIQIRINILDTATELEQWQESFKTAEDIIFLMDKYEKLTEDVHLSKKTDSKSKKAGKIPPMMKLEFYSNIEKLLWISDYHLYHSHAVILIKELCLKAQKWLKNSKNSEKLKDAKSKLDKYDIDHANNKILLSILSTPFKNLYTNYLTVGDELFETENEIETQTCSRMMVILKLNSVPSRQNLINFIETNKLLENCDEKIRNLYNLLENEKNPLQIGKKGAEILEYLRRNTKYEKYSNFISRNLVLKSLMNMSKLFDSISFTRLQKIFPWSPYDQLEEIISEYSRTKVISCTIDHSNSLVKFNNSENIKNIFNHKLENFLNSVEKISSEIIKKDAKNQKIITIIREVLYKEIHVHNTDSLVIYDDLIKSMQVSSSKLEDFLKEKEVFKEERKETQAREKKEQKEKAEEEAKMMKELLKDEQKKKEFDIQLKKYLIDRIRIYTNVLLIEGKKVKLDDILKELSKYSDEQLIKLLEKVEYEFKTKKEKRFKHMATATDYTIREFRRRDFEHLNKILENDEKNYNQTVETEGRRLYAEKIGQKSNLLSVRKYKDEFFNNIQTQRDSEYRIKILEFKESLEKKVRSDILKDIKPYFKAYIDEFRKKEEESNSKNIMAGKTFRADFIKKGENFRNTGDKPRTAQTTSTDFARSSKAIVEQPRIGEKISTEFKKGVNFTASEVKEEKISTEFKKGVNFTASEVKDEKKDSSSFIIKKGEKTEPNINVSTSDFTKGSNIAKDEKKEPSGFKRGEKIDISVTASAEIIKGNNVVKPTPTEKTTKETVIIKRGENANVNINTPQKEETGFKRGENFKDTGFKRAEQKETKIDEDIKKDDKWKSKDSSNITKEATTTTQAKPTTQVKPTNTNTSAPAKRGDGWRK